MTEIERRILNNQFDIMLVMANVIINLLPSDCAKIKDGENAMDSLIESIHNTADLLMADDEEQREAALRERMKNRG